MVKSEHPKCKHVTVESFDGTKISVLCCNMKPEIANETPLAILLPGLLSGIHESRNFYYPFAMHFPTVIYDYRGYYSSQKPNSRYDLDEFAKDLEAVIDEFASDKKFFIVGTSFGGSIAIYHAAKCSRTPELLVLFNPMIKIQVDPILKFGLKLPVYFLKILSKFFIPLYSKVYYPKKEDKARLNENLRRLASTDWKINQKVFNNILLNLDLSKEWASMSRIDSLVFLTRTDKVHSTERQINLIKLNKRVKYHVFDPSLEWFFNVHEKFIMNKILEALSLKI